ncbi:hypothetical protein V6K52_15880 [Knoellia sp. S7-12]|uniref:hypothetical protein n=1 Tax=Knoellia sp. S7-12 TaxID=3126698 RepID=UPI0033660D23
MHGAPGQYAGHPAYLGSTPDRQSKGLNPWVAACLGAFGGMLLATVVGALLWVATGGPLPWEGIDDLADDWTGSVQVASDGSVPGLLLSDAVLDVGGGGYYEEVVCPSSPRVAADVTTVCRVDDGYDTYRVVVLFLDDTGRFETAEVFSE